MNKLNKTAELIYLVSYWVFEPPKRHFSRLAVKMYSAFKMCDDVMPPESFRKYFTRFVNWWWRNCSWWWVL